MTLEQYIENLDKRYRLGNATEHAFRGVRDYATQSLFLALKVEIGNLKTCSLTEVAKEIFN